MRVIEFRLFQVVEPVKPDAVTDVLVLFQVKEVAKSPEIAPICKPAAPELLTVLSEVSVRVVMI